VSGDDERLGHEPDDLAPQGIGRPLPAARPPQHDEFVAAQPRNQVAFRQPSAQSPGHLLDQFIADMVAHRVVDGLEGIEIDIGHENVVFPALFDQNRQFGLEALDEMETIGQPRQRIVEGVILRLRLALDKFARGAPHPPDDQRSAPSASRNNRI
jgi:hypothetical protein